MQKDWPHQADRISKLEAALAAIEHRLHRVESRIGVSPLAEETVRSEVVARSPLETTPSQTLTEPVRIQPPRPQPARPSLPLFPFPYLTAELEVLIGTSWLNRLGILAIIAAVAYFLKFSFDNNWIGPSGRVGLTLLGGVLLLAAGEHYQRRRLPVFAQGLSGGGAAVLYLGIFSAFAIYRLIGVAPAFATMVLITLATMALALRYDSLAIATLGLLGGFATPFLLGGPPGGVEGARPVSTDIYVYFLLLDAAAYELARRRRWWRFGAVGLVAGFLAPAVLAQGATPGASAVAIYFLLLTVASLLLSRIFAMTTLAWAALVGGFILGPVAGVSYFSHIAPLLGLGYYAVITVAGIVIAERHGWRQVATAAAVAGTLFGSFGDFGPPLSASRVLVPHFAYLLVIAGAAVVAAMRRGWPSSAMLVMLSTGASAVGLAAIRGPSEPAATYLSVGGVTLLFLLFSVTAAVAGRMRTEPWMQMGILSALVYAGQLYLIFGAGRRDALALSAAGIAVYHLGVSRILMRRAWPTLVILVYLGLAITFLTIAIPLKLHQAAIPLAWSAESVVLAWAAARTQNLWAARAAAIVGALVAVRLVVFDTPTIAAAGRFVFSAPGFVFAFGIAALALAAFLLRPVRWPAELERSIPAALGALAAGLLLWWGGWEINGLADRVAPTSWFAGARHAALSAWLTLYGFGLVVAGVTKDVSGLRWAGIGLLVITILKVLAFDLSELQVVYRIASLMVLGVLLLLASLVYGRYQQRLRRESHP